MATRLQVPDQPSPLVDKKVSQNTNAMFTNAGTQTARISAESEKAGSPTTDAKVLLGALRNVIIPLVRPADGEYKHDANENALGPDGEEFVLALQQFMASFLHQRGQVGSVEIELREEEAYKPNAESQATSNDNLRTADVADEAPEPPPDRSMPEKNTSQGHGSVPIHNEEFPDRSLVSRGSSTSTLYIDTFEQRKLRFIEAALNALREHVFNTMPIRLLSFKPHASKLRIALLERNEIWAEIASSLKNIINFAAVSEEIEYWDTAFDEQPGEQFVITKLISKYSKYAILSHTWLRGASGEVTYGDWNGGKLDARQPGYQKLVNFCKTAWENHGVAFGWMDTVCINKESSAELDESIRSMYNWYSNADVCITYLAETVTLSDMPNDSWFTRGWTLQELLAPSYIKFYNAHWTKLVESSETDKQDIKIREQIEQATTISADELEKPLSLTPISRRMEIAAKRQVTREEDSAYCLMGIFDVSISIAYGEGAKHAFSRLLQAILNSSDGVIDMFNWAGPYGSRISRLLPPDLQSYLRRSSYIQPDVYKRPIEPLMLTHVGLRITIILMPAISIQNLTSQCDSIGDYHAIADISLVVFNHIHQDTLVKGSYSVLDASIDEGNQWRKEENLSQLMLGILNVAGGGDSKIAIPKHCLAVHLEYDSTGEVRKMSTEAPIVFNLNNRLSSCDENDFYFMERSELPKHGMKLATLYL